ncbi:TPA: hypothetical protein ACX369_003271 [Serratia marcescens]
MDSTLLGALIGGGFAVAGSVCTAIAAYFTNKHGEHAKIRMKKKEDLYISLIDLRESIIGFGVIFRSSNIKASKLVEKNTEFSTSRKQVRMHIDLYFPKLEPASKRLTAKLTKFRNGYVIENTVLFSNDCFDKENIQGENFRKDALSEVNKIIAAVSKVKI